MIEGLVIRKIGVLGSAFIYWTGVLIHAYRVRKRIGRSPNIKPQGAKEKLLWAGWFFVIAGWIGQPLMLSRLENAGLFSPVRAFSHGAGIPIGIVLLLCGHLGTLWSYSALGDSWRMGINRTERTILAKYGPYRWVRHPLYLFQIVILIGMTALLPTPFSFMLLLVLFACVLVKAVDEEAYLIQTHASEYPAYLSRTGRLLPKWKSLRHILTGEDNEL